MKTPVHVRLGTIAVAALTACSLVWVSAQGGNAVEIDQDDIGGVVSSATGPEAGVWVIAETTDLPTKFSRVVVTDEAGRYVLPDLPEAGHASYDVWVRGYGLVDSPKVKASPGTLLNLDAVAAPDPRAAAQYYPANYWYSMISVPDESEFPGTGLQGNGIPESVTSQAQWLDRLKTSGCQVCHQMGNAATREIPTILGTFESTVQAWERRLEAGQAGAGMAGMLRFIGRQRALEMFADWTDRIAAGELPPIPSRPAGLERNIVVTTWDYAEPHVYVHDAISTDKREPTINANGPIYGASEVSSDKLYVLDPVRHTTYAVPVPLRDPDVPFAHRQRSRQPSPYWGDELIWKGKTSVHSPMLDRQGRVWAAAVIRSPENPAWCQEGSDHPSAKLFPLARSGRQVNMYDPETEQFTLIDTCFSTHHLQFADDADDTLWFSSARGDVVGWLNTRMYEDTKNEQLSQGWTAFIVDTNGNGERDPAYVEPNEAVDPTKDKRFRAGFYSVIENPIDRSIWGSVNSFPGALVRLDLGSNPPETTLAEIFEPPFNNPNAPIQGYVPRGIDVDRSGVIWTNLSGSSHLASLDRRQCTGPLNGPTATGQHCPEGWTLYPLPGPQFKGMTEGASATASYYLWVDQFNTFGLGENIPIAIGNGSDSLLALDPRTGEFVTLRLPYPMSFYAKGMDGRIDDPDAGWKGRGLWVSSGTRATWHIEGGKGAHPKITKFQLRPDPLAK